MLVLSRKRNQAIKIGNEITLKIVEICGDKVRLGIDAPKNVAVHREEVFEKIERLALEKLRPDGSSGEGKA